MEATKLNSTDLYAAAWASRFTVLQSARPSAKHIACSVSSVTCPGATLCAPSDSTHETAAIRLGSAEVVAPPPGIVKARDTSSGDGLCPKNSRTAPAASPHAPPSKHPRAAAFVAADMVVVPDRATARNLDATNDFDVKNEI
jgi:hypothetical protein